MDWTTLLPLEADGPDAFTARFSDEHGPSVFGALLLGCATRAACRTVDDKPPASLHMVFLRPAPAEVPLTFAVERVRDGRRVAHRRVELRAGDRACAAFVFGFAAPQPGPAIAEHDPVGDAPPPEAVPSAERVAREEGWEDHGEPILDWRWIDRAWDPAPAGDRSRYRAWVRPAVPIGGAPDLEAGALAYLSDFHSHWPVARARGGGEHFMASGYTSLDTALWWHHAAPWRDWRLLESDCVAARDGRALGQRRLFEADGTPVATMIQDALVPA